MTTNVIDFNSAKKKIKKLAQKPIKKSFSFPKGILDKFIFKIKCKIIKKSIRIKPIYISKEGFKGVGYTVHINGDDYPTYPYAWHNLADAEDIAKLLAVEYILKIKIQKVEDEQQNIQ